MGYGSVFQPGDLIYVKVIPSDGIIVGAPAFSPTAEILRSDGTHEPGTPPAAPSVSVAGGDGAVGITFGGI